MPKPNNPGNNGAAKDDVLGLDGDFTFSIADLLANDPGGAAKDPATQFYFGTDPSSQAAYLVAHGITDNGNGTYTLTSGATDFVYNVQMGNNGAWSQANVDVTAPTVTPEPHLGDLLFFEDWEDYTVVVDQGQWFQANLGEGGWLDRQGDGSYGEVVPTDGTPSESYGDGNWLDTQNSPGSIDITNTFQDPTGDDFVISFDLLIHDFGDGPLLETPHDAELTVMIDGQAVRTVTYAEFAAVETFQHYEILVADAGDGDAFGNHTISFVDTTESQGNFIGFAFDNIEIHDWVI